MRPAEAFDLPGRTVPMESTLNTHVRGSGHRAQHGRYRDSPSVSLGRTSMQRPGPHRTAARMRRSTSSRRAIKTSHLAGSSGTRTVPRGARDRAHRSAAVRRSPTRHRLRSHPGGCTTARANRGRGSTRDKPHAPPEQGIRRAGASVPRSRWARRAQAPRRYRGPRGRPGSDSARTGATLASSGEHGRHGGADELTEHRGQLHRARDVG
jgi:hypothetical protein